MNAYIVRISEKTPQEGEIVGIFVCELADLAYNVDQCTDPGICEYAVAGAGGIYWTNRVPAVPIKDDGDWEDLAAAPVDFCEQWSEKLGSELVWKPV